MAAVRLSTGSRMSPWPGWAWAANVDGSICMSPSGPFAFVADGFSEDSCWAIVLRPGAQESGTPVREIASSIQASTLAGPIAWRRWAAKSPPGAGAAGGGAGAKRAQISATRARVAAIPSMSLPIGGGSADLNESEVNGVKQYAQCWAGTTLSA